MASLTPQQLDRVNRYLQQSGITNHLRPELLDHLACMIEKHTQAGLSFDQAFEQATQGANSDAIQRLQQSYQQELTSPTATLTDIVFEQRPKAYGAYALRQAYPNTLRTALLYSVGGLVVLLVCLLAILGPVRTYFGTGPSVLGLVLRYVPITLIGWYLLHRQTQRALRQVRSARQRRRTQSAAQLHRHVRMGMGR